jgi:putative Holliday junction resolvase
VKHEGRCAGASGTSGALPDSGTALAFDFGEKRIGVAVGDLALGSAHPLAVVAAEDNRTRFDAIGKLVAEWRPVLLVVGLPAHPDGTEHDTSRLARRFAQRLAGRFRLRTVLVDERFTSVSAESRLRGAGLRGERLRAALDSAAAHEILRDFLEARRRTAPAGP